MDFKSHEYTHVVVGKVPSFRPGENAGCSDARRQFDCYVRVLKELNLEVVEVDFGVEFPDNVFLEDLAIACHGIVLLLKPTSSEEELVVKALRKVLEEDLGQTIVELNDPNAKLAGSDVLFTGHEFFVGISETSNEAGASAVAEAFPEYPCTPIKIPSEVHHLKKYVTVAGPDILCVASCDDTTDIVKRMEREANFSYKTLTVPEDEASNCIYVNGTLIHRAIEEIPKSFKGIPSNGKWILQPMDIHIQRQSSLKSYTNALLLLRTEMVARKCSRPQYLSNRTCFIADYEDRSGTIPDELEFYFNFNNNNIFCNPGMEL